MPNKIWLTVNNCNLTEFSAWPLCEFCTRWLLMTRLQRIAAKNVIFHSSINTDFVTNAGFYQPNIRSFIAKLSPNFFVIYFWFCCQKCGVIVSNISVRNKRSMTRVTNYNITSDIINTVKLTKAVLSTFKMSLIIRCWCLMVASAQH